jgi:adenylosuccinate synthase
VDLDTLNSEIENLKSLDMLDDVKILVHENAAAVLDRHREEEKDGGTAPGSTRKGVGAAAIERIKRDPRSLNTIGKIDRLHPIFRHIEVVGTQELQQVYSMAERIQVEGCQGYSLSMYHGQYPYCTSRDVTTTSLLADCGVPFMRGSSIHVYGTFRTYPIRVANRPESGEWSGPTYPDSEELTFSDLGLPQEYTTVTKLPRRIFTFSNSQAREACLQNRVDSVFLNFAQYPPTFQQLLSIWNTLNTYSVVAYMGFGPTDKDVVRVGDPMVTSEHIRGLYEKARAALV